MTEDQRKDFRTAFNLFDKNRDGASSAPFSSPHALEGLWTEVYVNAHLLDASLPCHALFRSLTSLIRFSWFIGNVTVQELGSVMRTLGQTPTEAELLQIIAQVDTDGTSSLK